MDHMSANGEFSIERELESEIARLTGELETAQQSVRYLEEELNALKDERAQLEDHIDTVNAKLAEAAADDEDSGVPPGRVYG